MPEKVEPGSIARVSVGSVDGIVRIVLDNRRRKNALTVAMMEELLSALKTADSSRNVVAVVLEGAGQTFCTGLDIPSLIARESVEGRAPENLMAEVEGAVLSLGHPTIALVEGFAVGAGCQLASACDFRIAVGGCHIGVPTSKIGLVYPPSSLRRMRELIGDRALRRMIFTGDLAGSKQISAWDWAEVVDDRENAERGVADLASTLGTRSALSIRAAKELLRDLSGSPSLADELDLFDHWRARSLNDGELDEGLSAFAERRPAVFPSRDS